VNGSRAWRIGLLVVAMMVIPSPVTAFPPPATEDDFGQSADLTYDVANAIRFRESFGLQADVAFVERSVVDHQQFPDLRYGVPLTLEEASDIDARQKAAVSTQPALDYAAAQPEYAGMYFDQRAGGRPVFRFTEHLALHEGVIRGLLPAAVDPLVTPADYTLDELMEVYSRILEDRKQLLTQMPMGSVDVDVILNRVVVELDRPTAGAQRIVQDAYGDAVITGVLGPAEGDSCASRGNCGGTSVDPWKGGLKIYLAGNGGFWCTSGILARRGSNLVMITAAHCLVNNPADYGDNWKHFPSDPRTIGDALGGTIADGADDGCLCHGDVGWIDIDTYASVTPLNLFYASSSADIRSATDVPSDSDPLQQVGSTICRGGATSGDICGQVDKLVVSRTGPQNVDGHDVDMLRRTDFDASLGDSGAVMFYGPYFLGIHNDSLTGVDPPAAGHSFYSTGQRIEAAGNAVCTTSSC
jgi:hypothetical protein